MFHSRYIYNKDKENLCNIRKKEEEMTLKNGDNK